MGCALGPYRGRKRRTRREGLGARRLGCSAGLQNFSPHGLEQEEEKSC